MIKLTIRMIRILAIALLFCSMIAEAGPIQNEVVIFFEGRVKPDNEALIAATKWQKICGNLEKYLENRELRLGKGPFAKARCAKTEMTLAGVAKEQTSGFVLRVFDREDGAGLEIFYIDTQKIELEAQLNFSASERFFEMLDDNSAMKMIVHYLEDQLPFMSIVQFDGDQKTLKVIKEDLPAGDVQKYAIFSVEYDGKMRSFWPTFYGDASLDVQRAVYQLNVHQDRISSRRTYFVQDAKGRGKNLESIKILLANKMTAFGITFRDSNANPLSHSDISFSGIRYGYSLLLPDDAVSQAKLITAFIEPRSGLLRGLRFYYDIVPQVAYNNKGISSSFGWSRLNLGYVFKLPNWQGLKEWIDRWDFAPRFGLFSLAAKFEMGEEKVQESFVKNYDRDIGFELGIEKGFGKLTMRYWFGVNNSISGLNKSGDSYLALKVGLDSYFQVYNLDEKRALNVLLFFTSENVSIERKKLTYSEKGYSIDSLSFLQVFAGFGGTLSW